MLCSVTKIKRARGKNVKVLITTDWFDPVINGVVTSVHTLTKELVFLL